MVEVVEVVEVVEAVEVTVVLGVGVDVVEVAVGAVVVMRGAVVVVDGGVVTVACVALVVADWVVGEVAALREPPQPAMSSANTAMVLRTRRIMLRPGRPMSVT